MAKSSFFKFVAGSVIVSMSSYFAYKEFKNHRKPVALEDEVLIAQRDSAIARADLLSPLGTDPNKIHKDIEDLGSGSDANAKEDHLVNSSI